MQFQISHVTTYRYRQPILLQPHVIRLRPRCDGIQSLQSFSMQILPQPGGISQTLDWESNATVQAWFREERSDLLQVETVAQVTTHRLNPFDYLLEPWAIKLPMDYPVSAWGHLQPYLDSAASPSVLDSTLIRMVQELLHTAAGDTITFLTNLNQTLYHGCQQVYRETGDPLPPVLTWAHKSGSCRDLAVLFMALCRSVGLASRFVSGYQAGDSNQAQHHLHAWAEVYLPGAGWRGYDPTQGLAVADAHVAVAVSALPRHAAPMTGSYRGG
ncbi:transglutaminase family protein [Neosynechococcus sphagnicola]|uniref:transglutaminase family protein n=1 Tax=Neosynechococcus sphagnicola TaxID=1501145 RepID=UPI00068CA6E4|nr:transglutaminase family protein [Neosynechococcus sphagnicola]